MFFAAQLETKTGSPATSKNVSKTFVDNKVSWLLPLFVKNFPFSSFLQNIILRMSSHSFLDFTPCSMLGAINTASFSYPYIALFIVIAFLGSILILLLFFSFLPPLLDFILKKYTFSRFYLQMSRRTKPLRTRSLQKVTQIPQLQCRMWKEHK